MFAALTVVRFREAVIEEGLVGRKGWMSADEVEGKELPLARAVERVLGSMQGVLEKTMRARDEVVNKVVGGEEEGGKEGSQGHGVDGVQSGGDGEGKKRHLAVTKAAEVRVVRNVEDLKRPGERFRAVALEV